MGTIVTMETTGSSSFTAIEILDKAGVDACLLAPPGGDPSACWSSTSPNVLARRDTPEVGTSGTYVNFYEVLSTTAPDTIYLRVIEAAGSCGAYDLDIAPYGMCRSTGSCAP